MTGHSVHFEATGGGMVLAGAILLYRSDAARHRRPSRHDAAAFASLHGIEHDDEGRPAIAAGTPLSRAALRRWTEALGRTTLPELLPDTVLVAHPDMLAWWSPAQVRPAYFDLSDTFSFGDGLSGLKVLGARVVLPVPYPAHLFVATRASLRIYALPANRRPTAGTALLHSPILNIYVDGRLCWGSIPKPDTPGVAFIPDFERAVFDSWSTHAQAGQELTITGKGGPVRLWDDLAARGARRFPVSRLKPFGAAGRGGVRAGTAGGPMTVGRLIAGQ